MKDWNLEKIMQHVSKKAVVFILAVLAAIVWGVNKFIYEIRNCFKK